MGLNRFTNNTAKLYSSKVLSYPQKFRLNVKRLDGKDELVENEYTLDNFASNRQLIPLEFLFYDEMDDKIDLDKYVQSLNQFVNSISIKSIKTSFGDKIKKSIYEQQECKQINQAQFTNPDSIHFSSTWINDHLQVSASPLSQVTIEFRTDIIRRFNRTNRSFVNGSIFKLIINFRECQVGEYYDKEQNYCQKCPNNTFSFNINEPCKRYERVPLMEYAYGENVTSVKKGAWRFTKNTENIMSCTNPKHCQPDLQRYSDASNSSGNYLCRPGHIGPLCQSCDNYGVFWNQTYQYSVKDKVCVSCSDSSWTIIFFFLMLIVIGLFAAYTVNKQVGASQDLSLRQKLKSIRHLLISRSHRFLMASQRIVANKTYCDLNKKKQDSSKKYPMVLKYKERYDGYSYDVYVQKGDEKTKQQLNILKLDFNEIIQPTALIKIMVTYFLIFSITLQSTKSYFKNMKWQLQVFTSIGEPIKQATYSVECLIIGLGIKTIPVYVIKDTLVILSPLINWAVFLFLWGVILRSKVNKTVLINSLTFTTFYNYPQIIQTVFPAVIGHQYDQIMYIQSDPKTIYYSQQQFYFRVLFYIPILVLFLVVIPTILILFLWKNEQKLHDADFKIKFGFIYQEYRRQCYYIEFVKIAVKVSIIIVQIVFIDSLQLQISIIQQILTAYLIVIILVKPYTQHSANTIELYNIILCLLNMILVNSIYWSQQIDCSMTTTVFIVILVVFNSAFILIFIYFLFKQKIIEINESIINLKHTLLNAIPKLKNIKFFKSQIINTELSTKLKWQLLFKNIKKKRMEGGGKVQFGRKQWKKQVVDGQCNSNHKQIMKSQQIDLVKEPNNNQIYGNCNIVDYISEFKKKYENDNSQVDKDVLLIYFIQVKMEGNEGRNKADDKPSSKKQSLEVEGNQQKQGDIGRIDEVRLKEEPQVKDQQVDGQVDKQFKKKQKTIYKTDGL